MAQRVVIISRPFRILTTPPPNDATITISQYRQFATKNQATNARRGEQRHRCGYLEPIVRNRSRKPRKSCRGRVAFARQSWSKPLSQEALLRYPEGRSRRGLDVDTFAWFSGALASVK